MLKIFIIDDDPNILYVLKDYFAEQGEDVLTTMTGRNVLEKIRENFPDIILLDVILPEYNGMEILAKIKEDQELKDIPVILISGQDSSHSQIDGFKTGADDYVTKPLDLNVLYERIKKSLPEDRTKKG